MTDIVRGLWVVALGSASLSALLVTLGALFPGRTAKARAVAEAMPGRSTLIGLINFLFFGAAGFVLFTLANNVSNGLLKVILILPALVCVAALSIGLSLGLAGVAQMVGARLWPQRPEWLRSLAAAIFLTWASAVPLVGWFLLLPYLLWLGLGAFIIGFVYREKPVAESSGNRVVG